KTWQMKLRIRSDNVSRKMLAGVKCSLRTYPFEVRSLPSSFLLDGSRQRRKFPSNFQGRATARPKIRQLAFERIGQVSMASQKKWRSRARRHLSFCCSTSLTTLAPES